MNMRRRSTPGRCLAHMHNFGGVYSRLDQSTSFYIAERIRENWLEDEELKKIAEDSSLNIDIQVEIIGSFSFTGTRRQDTYIYKFKDKYSIAAKECFDCVLGQVVKSKEVYRKAEDG